MVQKETSGIGETSLKTEVSERQLRHWEDVGYIQPERVVCGDKSYRRYSPADIQHILAIKKFLDQGYKLQVAVQKANEENSHAKNFKK